MVFIIWYIYTTGMNIPNKRKGVDGMIYLVLIIIALIFLGYMKKEVTKDAQEFKEWVKAHKTHLLIILAIVGVIFYTDVALMVIGAWLIYTSYSYLARNMRVSAWENKETDEVEYRIIDNQIETATRHIVTDDKNNEEYKFESTNMPLGRVNAFLNYFERDILNEEIYYFSAKPSKNENELREYGLAVTGSGVFIAYQTDSKKAKMKEILFAGLSNVNYDAGSDVLTVENVVRYGTGFKRVRITGTDVTVPLTKIAQALTMIKQYNIPEVLFLNRVTDDYIERGVEQAGEQFNRDQNIKNMQKNIGNVATILNASERQKIYDEMGNDMNMRQGHGYGAEYGNKTVDKLLGRKVDGIQEKVNGHHKKDGADKEVNGQKVQVKYCKSATDTYREAFKNHDYSGQKIEVPRDQYNEIRNKLQADIDSGNIDGVKPGTPAETFLKKGFFEYGQSYRIAGAGGIEGIAVDMANGIITSHKGASISALIVFSTAIWQGKDWKEAAKDGLHVYGQTVGKGAVIFTITMQSTRSNLWIPKGIRSKFNITGDVKNPIHKASEKVAGKISNSSVANSSVGKKLKLDKITGQKLTSGVITVAVVFGPDVCKACFGKISVKQLAKNATVGGMGIAGSMIGTALTGGNPVGGIVGGAVVGSISKKVLDNFIEDDAVRMFRVLKEEFLDVVMSSYLTQEEFNEIATQTIWHKKIAKELQNMYKASKKGLHRKYAHDLIENVVIVVIKKRSVVTNEMWDKGLSMLN